MCVENCVCVWGGVVLGAYGHQKEECFGIGNVNHTLSSNVVVWPVVALKAGENIWSLIISVLFVPTMHMQFSCPDTSSATPFLARGCAGVAQVGLSFPPLHKPAFQDPTQMKRPPSTNGR